MTGTLMLMGLSGPELTADEERLAREIQPAGYVLHGIGPAGVRVVRALTDRLRGMAGRQPVVAVEFEAVRRMAVADGGPELPGAAGLAAAGDFRRTAAAGMLTGELLRLAGINLCLGPVLDLAFPGGPEGAWGMDPQRVIDHAGQWNRWLRKRGVAGCGGRFPIGLAPACADDADVLQRGALLPYTALMPELDAIRMAVGEAAGVEPGLPATLASGVVTRLLRDRLGFDHHVVIGGEVEEAAGLAGIVPAQAARMALEAGCDLVMVKNGASLAPQVARALLEVPGAIRSDAWMRVERLADRLHWPTPWSDARWRDWLTRAVNAAGITG